MPDKPVGALDFQIMNRRWELLWGGTQKAFRAELNSPKATSLGGYSWLLLSNGHVSEYRCLCRPYVMPSSLRIVRGEGAIEVGVMPCQIGDVWLSDRGMGDFEIRSNSSDIADLWLNLYYSVDGGRKWYLCSEDPSVADEGLEQMPLRPNEKGQYVVDFDSLISVPIGSKAVEFNRKIKQINVSKSVSHNSHVVTLLTWGGDPPKLGFILADLKKKKMLFSDEWVEKGDQAKWWPLTSRRPARPVLSPITKK